MILVIGATGRVGGEAVRLLAGRRAPVRAFVYTPEVQSLGGSLPAEIAPGDLRDPETLAAALEGVTKALLISPLEPDLAELQRGFVRAARVSGKIHVVKLSGLATSLDSPVLSGRWHALVERELEDSGLPFTFLRPHFFMQNVLGFAPMVAREGRFESSLTEAPIAMIDFRDIASIAVAVLTTGGHENKGYTITGPQALSMPEVAQEISRVIGREVAYRTIGREEEKAQLLRKGMPEWHVDLVQQFHETLSAGAASRVQLTAEWFAGGEARTLTGLIRENARPFSDPSGG